MRCFGVQYRCIFLLILCILTRPAGSSKYCRTRKNIQRYCTPKHSIRYIYYTILYYTILYYTILYYTILYYTILYYTILYYTILYYTILYYTILYYTILYYTILFFVLDCSTSAEVLSHLEQMRLQPKIHRKATDALRAKNTHTRQVLQSDESQ